MLKNLSVFVGYSNFHRSMLSFFLIFGGPHTVLPAAFSLLLTEHIVAAGNAQFFAMHQTVRQLLSRTAVDGLHRCTCHFHLQSTLFLCQMFLVHETDAFIFIQCHDDGLPAKGAAIYRTKPLTGRFCADASSFAWSWHPCTSVLIPLYSIIDICQ